MRGWSARGRGGGDQLARSSAAPAEAVTVRLRSGCRPPISSKIDFGEQLGIEQRPVLVAGGIVDAETAAKRIERVVGTREAAARQFDRVERPGWSEGRMASPAEFGIQELHVEGGIVDHETALADESEEVCRDGGEDRLVGQEVAAEPMNGKSLGRHVALRVDIGVKDAARRHMVEKLDRADLDDTVALHRIEAGGLGIENDLTHCGARSVG